MLVLSRRLGEEIVIDGAIRVRVVAMQNHRVRLGIVAPEDVAVDRQEVHVRRNEFAKPASADLECQTETPIDGVES